MSMVEESPEKAVAKTLSMVIRRYLEGRPVELRQVAQAYLAHLEAEPWSEAVRRMESALKTSKLEHLLALRVPRTLAVKWMEHKQAGQGTSGKLTVILPARRIPRPSKAT